MSRRTPRVLEVMEYFEDISAALYVLRSVGFRAITGQEKVFDMFFLNVNTYIIVLLND